MFVLTAAQSREADRIAIHERGIPATALMENAAKGAFGVLRSLVADLSAKAVAVVCGKGNNGGDGRLLAGLLEGQCRQVRILDTERFSPAAIGGADIIVDALLGTGLSRDVQGPMKAVIEEINRSGKWVLSLDVPSGLSADTGKPQGAAVRADATAAMGCPKTGLVSPEAAEYVGRLEVVDIGIPEGVYASFGVRDHWISAADVRPLLPPRKSDSHKGDYGHVLAVGGSETKPGAILLSGRAALRAGAGLVTIALPDKAFRKTPVRPPFLKGGKRSADFLELMYEPLPSHRSGSFRRTALAKILKIAEPKSALAVGPGMGVNADIKTLVLGLATKAGIPTVFDADALNVLASSFPAGKRSKAFRGGIVLTPHPGEMARLTGASTAAVQKDRTGVARRFAASRNAVVVLKGFRTLVATPSGDVFVNATGNAGMASAGMGDVLTGVIASLMAQGLTPERAAVAGVWLHGRAGDRVAERLGDRGLLAGDVIDEIPLALRELIAGGKRGQA